MRKRYCCLILLVVSTIVVGCDTLSKNNSFIGTWTGEIRESRADAAHNYMRHYDVFNVIVFLNHNTLLYDARLNNIEHYPTYNCRDTYSPCQHYEGWNHNPFANEACEALTYVVEDNKIVVTNGMILTIIDDNTLLKEPDGALITRLKNPELNFTPSLGK